MHEPALVIVARAPEHGRAKTRLARDIGNDAALAVYRQLLQHTERVASQWRGPVLLASTGDARAFAGTGLERHLRCEQPTGGLGQRLSAAMHAGCQLHGAAIVIGTDCANLRIEHLQAVAAAMQAADAVFGPATDGGFWAFGSSSTRAIDQLAQPDLPWSTPQTLQATIELLQRHGLSTRLGPTLGDVDTLQDLRAAVRSGNLQWSGDLHA